MITAMLQGILTGLILALIFTFIKVVFYKQPKEGDWPEAQKKRYKCEKCGRDGPFIKDGSCPNCGSTKKTWYEATLKTHIGTWPEDQEKRYKCGKCGTDGPFVGDDKYDGCPNCGCVLKEWYTVKIPEEKKD